MKKIIFLVRRSFSVGGFFLLFTFPFLVFSQAPQGLNYQAVVFGSNGAPLSNHAISLQLSVLDSTVSGNAVYVETQNATTDTTGLFSVVIGNGTIVIGTFPSINWGKNFKFLKTEIDTAAGNNFVVMGVTQFMSTPYALYANKTKTTLTSIDYPDGMDGMQMVFVGTTPYTVPTGKNLYCGVNAYSYLFFGSDTIYSGGFSENQTIYFGNDTLPCWLVDKTVDWITVDIITNPITVPVGKSFVVFSCVSNPYSFYASGGGDSYPNIYVNGQHVGPMGGNAIGYWVPKGFVLNAGQTLSAQLTGVPGQMIVNGFFRDN